jgi:hypothetical protein
VEKFIDSTLNLYIILIFNYFNNLKHMSKKELLQKDSEELLKILKTRFEKNMSRHENIKWSEIEKKLENNHEKLWTLSEMEKT